MDEMIFTYGTAAVIVGYFFAHVLRKRFDPFAPTWLFLVGYTQVYVIQPFTCHRWAITARGADLVASAHWRALWALLWFLLVYHLGPGRSVARALPRAPRSWSPVWPAVLCPPLILWGVYSSRIMIQGAAAGAAASPESSLLHSFPFMLMVAAILLVVTGRTLSAPRPAFLYAGLACAAAYVLIWMFNGKRSHSLIAVLATVCALYVTRLKRPSWSVLVATAIGGALVVAVAIGWRNDRAHERSFSGFASFLTEFEVSRILASLNVTDGEEEVESYETWEYGGFLLMMDTVPEKSGYDHGANYLRAFSTFIPRLLWPSKPIYGRSQWIAAWQAGSEIDRDDDFSSPAIGILGATQLNGGAIGTFVVIGCIALVLRTAYHYFCLHADAPWVQFFWSIVYYNAWFMVVGDDPLTWFYYNWGFTAFPVVVLMWLANRSPHRAAAREAGPHDPAVPSTAPVPWERVAMPRA